MQVSPIHLASANSASCLARTHSTPALALDLRAHLQPHVELPQHRPVVRALDFFHRRILAAPDGVLLPGRRAKENAIRLPQAPLVPCGDSPSLNTISILPTPQYASHGTGKVCGGSCMPHAWRANRGWNIEETSSMVTNKAHTQSKISPTRAPGAWARCQTRPSTRRTCMSG